ncbi:MAG: hypothetical protein IPN95_18100 [Bacteroidetes bacterium]|nr:hypothetical protein [Bacteroidota bacterium]
MKKYVFVLFMSVTACFGQVSVTPSMSKEVLSDLEKGQTDSLFLDIQRCYEMAGWKLNKPRPRLEKQDYLKPISMTNDERIIQTELMSQQEQGYLYWQNWSNLIADSSWNLKKAFPKGKDAYMVGNYTIMVIMAHELGHYYSEANNLRGNSSEWENIADHFAIAFLNELAEVNPKLKLLKQQFEQQVINDLYMAVKPELRTTIPSDLSLYEYVFHFSLPYGNAEYCSLQLAREGRLLQNKEFYLDNFMTFMKDGQRAILKSSAFIPYTGKYELIDLSSQMNIDVLNEYASFAGIDDIKVMNNGEFCVVTTFNDTVQLEVLTPEYKKYVYSIVALKDTLKSIIGNDISDPDYSSGHMELFSEPGKMILTAVQKTNNDSSYFHIINIDLQKKSITSRAALKEESYTFFTRPKAPKTFWQNNMVDRAPQIIYYRKYFFSRIEIINNNWRISHLPNDTSSNKYHSHTLDGLNKDFSVSRLDRSSNISPITISGDDIAIWKEPNNNTMFKIKKENQIYTLNANLYGEQIGIPFNTRSTLLGIWSPKYGFLFFDEEKMEVFGLKIK